MSETHVVIDTERLCRECEQIHADLWYPRNNPCKTISVGLMDVRAASDLLISYDFERDGWSIKVQPVLMHDGWGEDIGEPQEVAFVESHMLDKEATP